MNPIRFSLTILFFFSFLFANGQSLKIQWDKKWETNKMSYFKDVIEDKEGGFTVLGAIYSNTNNSNDFWLVRLNENGDTIWTKTFGTKFKEIPKRITQLNDGGYLLLGSVNQDDSEKILIIKADNKGNKIWEKSIDEELYCTGEDLVSFGTEGFLLVGSKGKDKTNGKLWMAALDNNGDKVWEKQFSPDFNGCCKSIKKMPNGNFSVAGQVLKPGQKDGDIWMMRTNEKGEPMWESVIPSPGLNIWPECVCCSPDSCFMVAGWQGTCFNDINSENPVFDYDLHLIKLDCQGKLLWTKNFDREGSEGGNTVVMRPDGKFVVAGIKATSFLGKVGPWFMLLDSDGNLLDEKLIDNHFNGDQVIKVINSSDGGLIVIGPGIQEESRAKICGWIMKFTDL